MGRGKEGKVKHAREEKTACSSRAHSEESSSAAAVHFYHGFG